MNELVSASQEQTRSRAAQFRGGLRAVPRSALDVVLPPLCPSCRAPLAGGAGLCAECWSKLSLIEPPFCARLGIPFTYDPGPGLLSMEAIANPPAYDRARAAVRYDDVARKLVHAYKYSDRLDLAPMLGNGWRAPGANCSPGPTRWCRCRCIGADYGGRRFNQSATLAGAISGQCGVPVLHDALNRVRATPQQVGLSKPQRADNVQGAFRVPPEKKAEVAGRRLVLIDDVLTSGATVDTCARALLRAGAAHVDMLVFARVVAAVRTTI